jgi:hypothetical protein
LIWKVQRRTVVTDVKIQQHLLEALMAWLLNDVETVLIGDGGFNAVDLMYRLQERKWHFSLRLHKDTWICLDDGTKVQLQDSVFSIAL